MAGRGSPWRSWTVLVASGLTLWSPPAEAIRPFVTDDARVVGDRLGQLETWAQLDRSVLEQNVLLAVGPHRRLELTLGLMHGGVHSGRERGYSLTGPILQSKILLFEAQNNGLPGLALSVGALPPLGIGAFKPSGWGNAFGYLAATESLFDERILVHVNLGAAIGDDGPPSPQLGYANSSDRVRTMLTAGIGTQVRLVGGLHGIVELYHGDPYDPRTDFFATQLGARYIFSEQVQVDSTLGSSLTAVESGTLSRYERWATLGLRLVSPALW